MWYWIMVMALFFVVLLLVEETAHYVWSRYVYGKRPKRQRKWQIWMVRLYKKLKKRLQKNQQKDIQM